MTVTKTTAFRVLIVEDEPADQECVKRALSKDHCADFELKCANQVSQAVDRLRSERFDVVLLDLGLPECSGLEALHEIRAESADIPIVVLTGLNDEKVALQAIEEGAQDYLVKGSLEANLLSRYLRYAIQRQELLATIKHREQAVRQAESAQIGHA